MPARLAGCPAPREALVEAGIEIVSEIPICCRRKFLEKIARPLALDNEKTPPERGFSRKRMKGLEPSTFCMASRRSSQLSYIREGRGL
jgi:hypothetical protein